MKKYKKNFTAAVYLISMLFVCCKTTEQPPAVSSLTMINAIADVPRLLGNFKGTIPVQYYAQVPPMKYGVYDNNRFSITKTEQPLGVFKFPDTLSTSRPLFNLVLHLKPGTISSLFFVGTSDRPDTLMINSLPPYHKSADSTFAVRFVNLSYLSKPVDIYQVNGGRHKEDIQALPYKGFSGYKTYFAGLETENYIFEFRDRETQALLTTYVLDGVGGHTGSLRRYRNFTLALKGLPGKNSGDQKQEAFLIDDY